MILQDLTPERLKKVKGTDKKYTCNVNIDWELGKAGSKDFVTVKAKTPFDVSVPKWLEWAANPHNPDLLFAAAVHDELLRLNYDKAVASAEFRRALKVRGFSGPSAWRLFFATLFWTAL